MTGIMCALIGGGGDLFMGPYSGTAGTGGLGVGYDFYGTGSIAPNDSFAGFTIQYLTWDSGTLLLSLFGDAPNSGWTTLTVNGNAFNRASALFSGGGPTNWTWAASNPFTNGAPYTAVFS